MLGCIPVGGQLPSQREVSLTHKSTNSHSILPTFSFVKDTPSFPRNARNFAFSVSFYFFCSPKFCRFQREIGSFFAPSPSFAKGKKKKMNLGHKTQPLLSPFFSSLSYYNTKGGNLLHHLKNFSGWPQTGVLHQLCTGCFCFFPPGMFGGVRQDIGHSGKASYMDTAHTFRTKYNFILPNCAQFVN